MEGPAIVGRIDFLPAHTVIAAKAGDQPLSFRRPVHVIHIPLFLVDAEELRQWAAEHAAQNLSAAHIHELLPELERRRQVLNGERVAYWVWGPLSQTVTMGHTPS